MAATTDTDAAAHLMAFNRVFDLDAASGQISVKTGAVIDFEDRAVYKVLFQVSDGEDAAGAVEDPPLVDDVLTLTVTVTDVAETETVVLSYGDPWAGVSVVAGLDGDRGEISALTWAWERSSDGTTSWAAVTGLVTGGNNLTSSYMPIDADVGYFIRASASFTDGSGERTVRAVSTVAVIAKPECASPANIVHPGLGNDGSPVGLWSDGRTLWVAMFSASSVAAELKNPIRPFALCAGTKLADPGDQFAKENLWVRSLWAEGPTAWVVHPNDGTDNLRGYTMHPSRGWVPDSDNDYVFSNFTSLIQGGAPAGLAVAGSVMWVSSEAGTDRAVTAEIVLAYDWAGRPASGGSGTLSPVSGLHLTREPGFYTNATTSKAAVVGSDGEFLWAARETQHSGVVQAFRIPSGGDAWEQEPNVNLDLGGGNRVLRELFVSGDYVWVSVQDEDNLLGPKTGVFPIRVPNIPPVFPDSDSDGTADPVARSLDENTTSGVVGAAITAIDGDDATLTYSVAATADGDAAAHLMAFNDDFDLDTGSGQISVKAGATIDFETRTTYKVLYQVTDNKDVLGTTDAVIDDELTLTITVINVNEPGVVAIGGTVQEGQPLTATLTDPDGSVAAEMWQWKKSATAGGTFTDIDGATAKLSSYTPVTADVDSFLRVSVTYTDVTHSAVSQTADETTGQKVVAAAVVHTVPVFSDGDGDGMADPVARSLAENTASGDLGAAITATDGDGDTLTYSVAATTDTDAAAHLEAFERVFDLDAASGQISVKTGAVIDFEDRAVYKVQYQVSDGEDAAGAVEDPPLVDDVLTLTVTVTDVAETETVVLSYGDPWAGVSVVAGLDGDRNEISALTWAWERSSDGTTSWAAVTGLVTGGNNLTSSYMPIDADVGYFIRASVTFTDGSGQRTVLAASTAKVIAKPECASPANIVHSPGELGNDGSPAGLWSDGRTMWVAMESVSSVAAELKNPIRPFELCAGTKLTDPGDQFADGNRPARSIWAEGPTAWVRHRHDGTDNLRGYTMHPSRGWVPDSDNDYVFDQLTSLIPNGSATGLAVAGTTMWVSSESGTDNAVTAEIVLAYDWAGRPGSGGTGTLSPVSGLHLTREPGFYTIDNASTAAVVGSDGEFLWAARAANHQSVVQAFRIPSGGGAWEQEPNVNLALGSGAWGLRELWVGGDYVWVSSKDGGNVLGQRTGVFAFRVPNIPPVFPDSDSDGTAEPVARSLAENTAPGDFGAPIIATDEDVGDTLTYSVAATGDGDAAANLEAFNRDFSVDANGQISVNASGAKIDFEMRESYKVLYQVTDGKDALGAADMTADDELTLTITVINVNEPGVVAIGGTVQEGQPLTATLTDPDGSVSAEVWKWWKGTTADATSNLIGGAGSASYTPVTGDVDSFLRASVTYTDSTHNAVSQTADETTGQKVVAAAAVPVSFGSDTYTVPEGGSVSVTVELSAAPQNTVTVPVEVAGGGGAVAGDYTVVPTTVTFTTGDWQTAKTIMVTAVDDLVDDDGESVVLSFGALPSGVSLGTHTTATVTITDNDAAGVTVPSAPINVTEGLPIVLIRWCWLVSRLRM